MRSMRSDVMESAVSGAVLATGLFGKTSVNSVARWNGLVFGDFHLFTAQLISILVTIAVAVCGTLICIGIVRIFTPLRVDVSAEISGLEFLTAWRKCISVL